MDNKQKVRDLGHIKRKLQTSRDQLTDSIERIIDIEISQQKLIDRDAVIEMLQGMKNDTHNIMIAEALGEHESAKVLVAYNKALDKAIKKIGEM